MTQINDDIIKDLNRKSKKIRSHIINMIYHAGSGHPGGSLSCVDILTVLYFYIMRHDPSNPKRKDKDIFILSKGHAVPALYATLAESGYFSTDCLLSLRKIGCNLQGHADSRVAGIIVSTGSLGQGLSVACGIALAAKIDNRISNINNNFKIYVLLGDGECDEGQIWEAAMFASHYKLDNLIAIIDRNGLQIDGTTEKIMSLEPLDAKWRSFGWKIIETDGNNIKDLIVTFDKVKMATDGPMVIIAHTIKGKGVSFMERNNEFHGKAPNKEEMILALKELEN